MILIPVMRETFRHARGFHNFRALNEFTTLYVGSSTTAFATPGHGLYSGSKIAAQFLVEVLAKEIGSRGVTATIADSQHAPGSLSSRYLIDKITSYTSQWRPVGNMLVKVPVVDKSVTPNPSLYTFWKDRS